MTKAKISTHKSTSVELKDKARAKKLRVAAHIASGIAATRAQHPLHKIKDSAVIIAATSLIVAEHLINLSDTGAKDLSELINEYSLRSLTP